MTPVMLEPEALWSRVKHSTTEPLRCLSGLIRDKLYCQIYTIGNSSVRRRRDFRPPYMKNLNMTIHSHIAQLEFPLKLERCNSHEVARHPTKCDRNYIHIITSGYFRQFIAGYNIIIIIIVTDF